MRQPRSRLAALLAGSVLALGPLAGCASSPGTVGSTGVDGLVVPTPSPAAASFADAVRNPWLPLSRGSALTWTVMGADAEAAGTATLEVLKQPREVAGVATTAVRLRVERAGAPPQERTDLLAEDRRGNVWWFGREGVWQAGVDGAEAGLVVTARPRVGDGYRAARLPGGRGVDRVTVVAADEALTELRWTGPDGAATVALGRDRGPLRVERPGGEVWILEGESQKAGRR